MRRGDLLLTVVLALALVTGGVGSVLSSANAVDASVSPSSGVGLAADDPDPRTGAVKLVFIHHCTGENWLADGNGDLGIALRDASYFASHTNYGWEGGGSDVGDRTDIGHWWEWFANPNRDGITADLYAESDRSGDFSSRLPTDPGGENEIVMFKSCFPNPNLSGGPDAPPHDGREPPRGQGSGSEHMTVANAKGIYNDILSYFESRQDKLFVVITAPLLVQGETDATLAANVRALNDWLVNDWLHGHAHHNVAVFDFYNVLTSNGGDANTNDLGSETGSHHRWWNRVVQHVRGEDNDCVAYGSDAWDSHPTAAGGQKATGEFVELLNVFYHR